ncbi:MAG: hypothetical protein HKN76_10355, partial [Saprospiraceae bacterium]|nr:hypothetical protein [Saprospiraceae bacterium]
MIQAKLLKSLLLVAIVTFIMCGEAEPEMNLTPRDLLEYGVPITVDVPDSVKIKAMDWGIQKDISIKGKNWYD